MGWKVATELRQLLPNVLKDHGLVQMWCLSHSYVLLSQMIGLTSTIRNGTLRESQFTLTMQRLGSGTADEIHYCLAGEL